MSMGRHLARSSRGVEHAWVMQPRQTTVVVAGVVMQAMQTTVVVAVVAGKDGDGTDGREGTAGRAHVSGSEGGRFSNLPTVVGGSRDQFANGLFVKRLYFPDMLLQAPAPASEVILLQAPAPASAMTSSPPSAEATAMRDLLDDLEHCVAEMVKEKKRKTEDKEGEQAKDVEFEVADVHITLHVRLKLRRVEGGSR